MVFAFDPVPQFDIVAEGAIRMPRALYYPHTEQLTVKGIPQPRPAQPGKVMLNDRRGNPPGSSSGKDTRWFGCRKASVQGEGEERHLNRKQSQGR